MSLQGSMFEGQKYLLTLLTAEANPPTFTLLLFLISITCYCRKIHNKQVFIHSYFVTCKFEEIFRYSKQKSLEYIEGCQTEEKSNMSYHKYFLCGECVPRHVKKKRIYQIKSEIINNFLQCIHFMKAYYLKVESQGTCPLKHQFYTIYTR